MHELPSEIPGEELFRPEFAKVLHEQDAEARRIIGEFMEWLATLPHCELEYRFNVPCRPVAPSVDETGTLWAAQEAGGIATLTLTGPPRLFQSEIRQKLLQNPQDP